jgi:two-component system, LytTR family, response regulator
MIALQSPALLFLDIEMPGGTESDLLAQLNRPPPAIFTTAYDQHAVKAFDVSPLDYLLKPMEPERLGAALSKLRAALPPVADGAGPPAAAGPAIHA